MVKHQNILVIVTILLLAAIILLAKSPKHTSFISKHYSIAPLNMCITIAYGQHVNDGANLLDLYLPDNSTAFFANKKSYPLIVFIHGGAWQSGDKSLTPDATEFIQRGYALASINYRLVGQASHPAQIEDCKAAVNWLRAHAKIFNINPDRIWGISAGGHLAALLGTTCNATSPGWSAPEGVPCRVQAICDWCGLTDLTTIAKQADSHYVLGQAVASFLGGTPAEKPALAKEASPITYVCRGLPPFLIMHGDKDTIVPVEQSKELAAALKAAHVSTNLQIIPGAGHMFASPENTNIVFHFFDQALKKSTKNNKS
jgi:acetyl esterase/lipase